MHPKSASILIGKLIPACRKCRHLDFCGIPGDVCRGRSWSCSASFLPYLCLDTYVESGMLPREGVQDHCSDSTIRIGGKGRTIFPGSGGACRPWLSQRCTCLSNPAVANYRSCKPPPNRSSGLCHFSMACAAIRNLPLGIRSSAISTPFWRRLWNTAR